MFLFKKAKKTVMADDRLKHIAFIMDGNGRWATKRSMPREVGHINGAKNFKKIVRHCGDIGIKAVTVYAFSTENWKRPKAEVDAIMKLLSEYVDDGVRGLDENNIRFVFLGDKSVLTDELRDKAENLEKISKDKELLLNIALNYGARAEIVHAFNTLAEKGIRNVAEEDISAALYTAHCPDPDIIVRTGGDIRLSNFLLWQAAYSELFFTDILWPDLKGEDVDRIIEEFYKRKRRYGGI